MDIDKLIDRVIPPRDYQHRNGFNNVPIIENLAESERVLLENALLQKLQSEAQKEIDTLIVETLAFLKSVKSVSTLKSLLAQSKDAVIRLRIATAIFEINSDVEMVDIALSAVKQMDNERDAYYVYKLTAAFYYLAKFKNEKTEQLLKAYTGHREYLISYNAQKALSG